MKCTCRKAKQEITKIPLNPPLEKGEERQSISGGFDGGTFE